MYVEAVVDPPVQEPEIIGENECPPQTAVGVALITVAFGGGSNLTTFMVPIFNIEPSVGEPAKFGFSLPRAPVILDTAVRTGGDYGVTVNVNNITQTAGFIGNEVTFWGFPGDPRHDSQRGWECLKAARKQSPAAKKAVCNHLEDDDPLPLLSMPTSCSGGPLQTSVEADPWVQAGDFQTFAPSTSMPTLDGCNRLPFDLTISVAPDGQAGSTPTGLTVGVHVPQDLSLNPTGLAEANVKDTTVALPSGVALNPAAADGLTACSEAQVSLGADSQDPALKDRRWEPLKSPRH